MISRLEDADYGSQSLTMLYRIAKALGKRLEVKFVAAEQNIQEEKAIPRSHAEVKRPAEIGYPPAAHF